MLRLGIATHGAMYCLFVHIRIHYLFKLSTSFAKKLVKGHEIPPNFRNIKKLDILCHIPVVQKNLFPSLVSA